MDNGTWAKISQESKRSWLSIKEADKETILKYGAVRTAPNTQETNPRRDINNHELIFDDPHTDPSAESPVIEVRTHERQVSFHDATPQRSAPVNAKSGNIHALLHMATNPTSASSGDIAQVLSQQTHANRTKQVLGAATNDVVCKNI